VATALAGIIMQSIMTVDFCGIETVLLTYSLTGV